MPDHDPALDDAVREIANLLATPTCASGFRTGPAKLTGIQAPLAAQSLDEGAIDNDEFQPKLLQHLIAPLYLKRRRADNRDPVSAVAEHQLQDYQAGLDGLAEANIVRDEQVDAGHLNGADHRVELIAFGFDAASERRLKLAGVCDGGGAPADGVEKRFEVGWLVKALRLGQLHFLECTGARLDLPDDLQLFAQGVTKAQEWELLPDSFANPLHRVRLPRKWEVRQKRILSPEQTMRVLARLRDPVLLISQTCLETGARISEVTGLRIQHVDLQLGCVRIEQRHWRGDIDEPKTARSRRTLALGTLRERYRRWIGGLADGSGEGWVFPQQQDGKRPMWDSGVRKALKLAAEEEGCDFAGLGLHTLRRANITWRQEVGGSSIEASQIAGHANSKMTGEYTVVQLRRQEELTQRLQEKLAQADKRRVKSSKITRG